MPKRLSVPLSDQEMEALDSVRGEMSKAQFARQAIMSQVWEMTVDQEYQVVDPVEDWRKVRGL